MHNGVWVVTVRDRIAVPALVLLHTVKYSICNMYLAVWLPGAAPCTAAVPCSSCAEEMSCDQEWGSLSVLGPPSLVPYDWE